MQSSTKEYTLRARASNAVDGNADPVLDNGHCTHTHAGYEPWWAVDLGARYYVLKIIITNRGDYGGNGISVWYLNNSSTRVQN